MYMKLNGEINDSSLWQESSFSPCP